MSSTIAGRSPKQAKALRGVALHTKASPETIKLTAQYEPLCRAPLLENGVGRPR
jgi:hypothetical protein